jgi:hypothetical protein
MAMTETVQIAIVSAAAAIAGGVVTHWFETRRELARTRAEDERLGRTYDNERRIRIESFIRELRARQAERIRGWIERQLIASVDGEHLRTAANVQGDPVAQAASLAAAQTILESRAPSDGGSTSINAALSGVTDGDLVRLVRKLTGYDIKFRENLQPLRRFLNSNPMPWNETQQQELHVLGEELRAFQERFDDALVEVYGELERYCAVIEE